MSNSDPFADIRNAKHDEPRHNLRASKDIAPQNVRRTWAYYQKLKSADPKYYQSREVDNQMQRDALRLGASFFVTDESD